MSRFSDQCRTLVDILSDFATREADRVFCRIYLGHSDAVALSYGELVTRGLRFASLYRRNGAMPGDTITIVLPTGTPLICSFVGALLGGFIPSYAAPLSDRQQPAHYWEQLKLQLHRLDHGFLVVDESFAAAVPDALELDALTVMVAEEVEAIVGETPIHHPAPDDIAFLQHSSGTTGGRKGVALSHGSVIEQLKNYSEALGLCETDVIVSWLPLYHDMGLISSYLLPMLSGTPLILLDPFEWVDAPWLLLARISQHRGTLVWLPNFAFHLLARVRLVDGKPLDLSSVRAFINCSEPCKAEAFDLFLERFGTMGVTRKSLHICYAMAETVFAVTQTSLGEAVAPKFISRIALQGGNLRPPASGEDTISIMPVGTPLRGVRLKVADEYGQKLPDGKVGEVMIAADYMFSGYYKEPELTDAAFQDGFYRSGDLGGFFDGQLCITGRKKDVIIVNGKNFYAHDIEAAVNKVGGVKPGRCVAFGTDNARVGSEMVCILAESEAPAEQHTSIARAVKEAILAHLGLVAGKVVVLPPQTLIKTTSGKISRKENKALFLERISP